MKPEEGEIYRLIIDKCLRMNLLTDPLIIEHKTPADFENELAEALLPGINKLLNKSLFELYQALYVIDVSEQMIKEKIMDLENTTMIPAIVAFAIIDRLKARYRHYPLLNMA